MKPLRSPALNRRSFVQRLGLAVPAFLAGCAVARPADPQELAADLIILGGGLGGCAAALAATRNGLKVILTEETDWIGGQLTQQLVPPDENRWIETFGASRSYQALRTGIRDYYRQHYPLTDAARQEKYFNPGRCWVSPIAGEPRVALAVLHQLLAPAVASGQLQILLSHQPVAAEAVGDRVRAVRVKNLFSGNDLILHAPWFADATEQGDLLPLTGTEYALGAEARRETGEPHAKTHAEPNNIQGFTCGFILEYLPGENHVIDRPAEYQYWRDFTLQTKADAAPYHLITFESGESRHIGFDPAAGHGFWTYRRIADRTQFRPGFYPGDLSIVNWPQNDYSFGLICDVSAAEFQRQVARAKQLSLSALYWLQTEAPRPDGGTGWKGLRLRPDLAGTTDGLSKYPYIREGRRIKAEFTVLEQHVSTAARMHETGLSKSAVRATPFFDSVGIGSYHMDLHLTTTGDHGAYGSTLPFQIPLGALLPRRIENLLPAAKNLGVTHLTNGCYRLHPVEWGVGEAVGTLAAFCQVRGKMPHEVRRKPGLLAEYQQLLTHDGVRLNWPPEAGAI